MTKEEFRDYVDFLRSQDEISYDVYSGLIDGIDTLEQEPKTGLWIESEFDMSVYCSECNSEHEWMYDFCPSCGADMRADREEEK